MTSAIYVGRVTHARHRPRRHRFAYGVFSFLIDLDELPRLDRDCRLFSHNRFNLFSFHDRDHGPGDGTPLRDWVAACLAEAGMDLAGGPVRLLCYPRILGYVFNPITVYYCHDPAGRLGAMLYEVSNTFGESHTYVIPATEDGPVILPPQ